MKRIVILTFFSLLITVNVQAQKKAPDTWNRKKIFVVENDTILNYLDSIKNILPSLELSFEGANKAVFWGRTFGLNQYTILPAFVLSSGKGLYIYNTNYYWDGDRDPSLIAKSDLGIGYDKEWSDILSTGISYERWIYFNGDSFIKKAIQNSLEGRVTAEFDWFNVELSGYYMFGKTQIFESDLDLSQEFYLGSLLRKTRLYFIPEMTFIGANKNFLPIYSASQQVATSDRGFRLLDYDLFLPLKISRNNFEFSNGLHFNIPINQMGEHLKPFFYYNVTISYTFYWDKKNKLKK